MKLLFSAIAIFISSVVNAQQAHEWKATSANKLLKIILRLDVGKLSYRVLSGADLIIKPSALGIVREDGDFSQQLSFEKFGSSKVAEVYQLKIGKRRENRTEAEETNVTF